MGTRPEGTEDPRDRGTTSHERGMDTGDLLVAWLTVEDVSDDAVLRALRLGACQGRAARDEYQRAKDHCPHSCPRCQIRVTKSLMEAN